VSISFFPTRPPPPPLHFTPLTLYPRALSLHATRCRLQTDGPLCSLFAASLCLPRLLVGTPACSLARPLACSLARPLARSIARPLARSSMGGRRIGGFCLLASPLAPSPLATLRLSVHSFFIRPSSLVGVTSLDHVCSLLSALCSQLSALCSLLCRCTAAHGGTRHSRGCSCWGGAEQLLCRVSGAAYRMRWFASGERGWKFTYTCTVYARRKKRDGLRV
jgi:hypothetical protein